MIRTEEGVQRVCKGVCGSISKYYLEEPLYTHLRGLLSIDPITPPGIGESGSDTPNTPSISTKFDLILKIAADVESQVKRLRVEVKRLSEADENVEFTEPKMEQSFPFEEPLLPMIPSAPEVFMF